MTGLNPEQAEIAFEMRKNGKCDFAKIGRALGVSRGVARYHFEKFGDPLVEQSVKQEKIAIAMQKKGATTAEIVAATGLTERQVQYHTVEKIREKEARARPVNYVRHEPSAEQWADLERRQRARDTAPLSALLCGDPVIPRHASNKDTEPQKRESEPFAAWNIRRTRQHIHPLEKHRLWQSLRTN